ncbi:hypothetical protein TYRP_000531 [Tyrophagus putrescentiae]|nr:hypothetical protein TYRP_000531 [Tyrophagus putrescentiae]
MFITDDSEQPLLLKKFKRDENKKKTNDDSKMEARSLPSIISMKIQRDVLYKLIVFLDAKE